MKYITIITFFAVALISCKKKQTFGTQTIYNPDCDVVFDYTQSGQNGTVEWYEDSVQFKLPTFNPNNSNEIIYQYIDHSTFTFKIKKFNIATGESSVIANNFLAISQPAWGENGKIAIVNTDEQIWMVNDDGTNLVPYATDGINVAPQWAFNNKLIWLHIDPFSGAKNSFIQTLGQVGYDTLIYQSSGATNFVMSNSNRMLARAGDNNFYALSINPVSQYTFGDFNLLSTYPSQIIGSTEGLCWHPSGTKYYLSLFPQGSNSQMGVYEILYPSGVYKMLVNMCDSKQYVNISCSPNGKYLVAERLDLRQDFSNQGEFTGYIERKSSIYLIDLTTKKEIKLNLD